MKIVKNAKALAGGLLAGAQLLLLLDAKSAQLKHLPRMLKLIAMGASGLFAAVMSILMVTRQ